MASHKRSPQYLNRGCMCNWGPECLKFKKLFAEAGHVSQMRMIPIKPGASDHSVALRSIVKFIFKLGPEYDNTDFYVAAHHWPPSLIERNYSDSLSTLHSRNRWWLWTSTVLTPPISGLECFPSQERFQDHFGQLLVRERVAFQLGLANFSSP